MRKVVKSLAEGTVSRSTTCRTWTSAPGNRHLRAFLRHPRRHHSPRCRPPRRAWARPGWCRCIVREMTPRWLPRCEVLPAWEHYPSGERRQPIPAASHEPFHRKSEVRRIPEQYYWVHKRFKTRPPGEAEVSTEQHRERPAMPSSAPIHPPDPPRRPGRGGRPFRPTGPRRSGRLAYPGHHQPGPDRLHARASATAPERLLRRARARPDIWLGPGLPSMRPPPRLRRSPRPLPPRPNSSWTSSTSIPRPSAKGVGSAS